MVSCPQCEHVSCNNFSPRSKNSQSISITSREKKTAWHQLESDKLCLFLFSIRLTDIISDIAVCLRVSDICSFGNYGMEAWPIAVWHPGLFLHRAFKLPPISCNDKFGSRSKRNMQYIARVQFWKKMSFRDKFNGELQSGFGCLNRTSSMNWISWLAHRSSSGSPSFWVPSIAGQCFKMFLWRHGHSAELLVGKVCKPAVWQQHLT